jgi:outer membrane immunogenic protein
MKRAHALLLGLTMASLAAFPAGAADIYGGGGYKDAPPPFVSVAAWTGAYIGVNAGGGWSDNNDQLAFPGLFNGLQPSGGFGGFQVGYNWQNFGYAPLVLGIEADFQGSGIRDRGSDVLGDVFKSRLDDFGTLRGRLGYGTGGSLFYVTGGFAYGSVRNEVAGGGSVFTIDRTATGYVLGGGFEYKINPAMSIKGEYQFINLGKNDPFDVVGGSGSFAANGGIVRDDAFHTVRVGFNWFPFTAYQPIK